MGRTRFTRFAALAAVVGLVASGTVATTLPAIAGSSAVRIGQASAEPTAPPVPSTAKPGQIVNVNGKDHIVVRWFVGLGSGTNPAQIALQHTVVDDFNA